MIIEHVTDGNNATTGRADGSDMIDIQRAIVAGHIADLGRERSAIRAERDRDHLRVHGADGATAAEHPVNPLPRRVRLGNWLVSVGEAIAGPTHRTAA
jgi:hypothetical protein